MKYALYDTVGDCWMGNSEGVREYDDFLIARIAAEVVDVQLGQTPGQTKAMEYTGGANKLRGEYDTKYDTLTALKRLESGRIQ